MTIVDVIKKALLPLAAMVFWIWMVKTIMGVTGNTHFMYSKRKPCKEQEHK